MVAMESFMLGDIICFEGRESELFYFESAYQYKDSSGFFIVNIRSGETSDVNPLGLKLVRRTQFFIPNDVVYIRTLPNLGNFTILHFNPDGSCHLKSKKDQKAPEIDISPISLLLVSRTTAEIDWVTS